MKLSQTSFLIHILATNIATKKIQDLLTSCANILYSSSLVTEILSLSVLSTTTITNFKKPKVMSQHFKEHTAFFQPHVLTQIIAPIRLFGQPAGLSGVLSQMQSLAGYPKPCYG